MTVKHRLIPRGVLVVAGYVTLFAGSTAAPARADDASTARAWCGNAPAFAVLNRQENSADAAFDRTGRTASAGPLIGVQHRRRALLIRTRRGLLAQKPSTPTGTEALGLGLRSLWQYERMTRAYEAGVRAFLRRDRTLGGQLYVRGNVLNSNGTRDGRRAITLFRQAGVPTPPCVGSCPLLKSSRIRPTPLSRASACRRP